MIIKPVASRKTGQRMIDYLLDVNKERNAEVEVLFVSNAVDEDLVIALKEFMYDHEEDMQFLEGEKGFMNIPIAPEAKYAGTVSNEQYLEGALRVMKAIGMGEQDFVLVKHVKHDLSEHVHAVVNRIDYETWTLKRDSYAINKAMRVAHQLRAEWGHDPITVMSENFISDAFYSSKNAKQFVSTLSDAGLELARGNKDIVMTVDRQGKARNLRRQIIDEEGKKIRVATLKAFLGKEYAANKLPSVEDIKQAQLEHQGKLINSKSLKERISDVQQRANAKLLSISAERELKRLHLGRDVEGAIKDISAYEKQERPELNKARTLYRFARHDLEKRNLQRRTAMNAIKQRNDLMGEVFKDQAKAVKKFEGNVQTKGIVKTIVALKRNPKQFGAIQDARKLKNLVFRAEDAHWKAHEAELRSKQYEDALVRHKEAKEQLRQVLLKPDEKRIMLQRHLVHAASNATGAQFSKLSYEEQKMVFRARRTLNRLEKENPERAKTIERTFEAELKDKTQNAVAEKRERILKDRDQEITATRKAFRMEQTVSEQASPEKPRTERTDAERRTLVTELYKEHSEDLKAFGEAIHESGFILARGHLKSGNPTFMLVDEKQEVHELYRQIRPVDGEKIKKKEIHEPLQEDYPFAKLPSVEDAKLMQREREEQSQTTVDDTSANYSVLGEGRPQIKNIDPIFSAGVPKDWLSVRMYADPQERLEFISKLYYTSTYSTDFERKLTASGFALARDDNDEYSLVTKLGSATPLQQNIMGIEGEDRITTEQLQEFMKDDHPIESLLHYRDVYIHDFADNEIFPADPITRAFAHSENATAFVQELEANGLMLTGDPGGLFPYWVFRQDGHGYPQPLHRMIDNPFDTKEIFAFLGPEFPAENLPYFKDVQEDFQEKLGDNWVSDPDKETREHRERLKFADSIGLSLETIDLLPEAHVDDDARFILLTNLYREAQQKWRPWHSQEYPEYWNPHKFLNSLDEHGFVLVGEGGEAREDYGVVDLTGRVHWLQYEIMDWNDQRLEEDEEIRIFLRDAFPPANLPVAKEAKEMQRERLRTEIELKGETNIPEAIKDDHPKQAVQLQPATRKEVISEIWDTEETPSAVQDALEEQDLILGHDEETGFFTMDALLIANPLENDIFTEEGEQVSQEDIDAFFEDSALELPDFEQARALQEARLEWAEILRQEPPDLEQEAEALEMEFEEDEPEPTNEDAFAALNSAAYARYISAINQEIAEAQQQVQKLEQPADYEPQEAQFWWKTDFEEYAHGVWLKALDEDFEQFDKLQDEVPDLNSLRAMAESYYQHLPDDEREGHVLSDLAKIEQLWELKQQCVDLEHKLMLERAPIFLEKAREQFDREVDDQAHDHPKAFLEAALEERHIREYKKELSDQHYEWRNTLEPDVDNTKLNELNTYAARHLDTEKLNATALKEWADEMFERAQDIVDERAADISKAFEGSDVEQEQLAALNTTHAEEVLLIEEFIRLKDPEFKFDHAPVQDHPDLQQRLERKEREFETRIEQINLKREFQQLANDTNIDQAVEAVEGYDGQSDDELLMREVHLLRVAERISESEYHSLSEEQQQAIRAAQESVERQTGVTDFSVDTRQIEELRERHQKWLSGNAEQRVKEKRGALREQRRNALSQIRKNFNAEMDERIIADNDNLDLDDPELGKDEGPELDIGGPK